MTSDVEASQKARLDDWHNSLSGNRGDRAALRRGQSADDAFGNYAFHALYNALTKLKFSQNEMLIARVALAIAEIDKNTNTNVNIRSPAETAGDDANNAPQMDGHTIHALGQAFAKPGRTRPALVSSARLRLLANTEDPDMFLRLLRGLIDLLDREAPVWETACLIRDWHSPGRRARARRQLLLDYYAHAASDA